MKPPYFDVTQKQQQARDFSAKLDQLLSSTKIGKRTRLAEIMGVLGDLTVGQVEYLLDRKRQREQAAKSEALRRKREAARAAEQEEFRRHNPKWASWLDQLLRLIAEMQAERKDRE